MTINNILSIFTNKFTIGASSNIIFSYCGVYWNDLGIIFNGGCNIVAYNGIMWIAGGKIGDGVNTLAYSYNGIDWTGIGSYVFGYGCYGIAWSKTLKLWIGVGRGSVDNINGNSIAYSFDGFNWTGLGNSLLKTGSKVACSENLIIAVGSGITTIVWSINGYDWFPVSNSKNILDVGNGIGYNGKRWISVGSGFNGNNFTTGAYSNDGINWIPVDCLTTRYNVAWNGKLWNAVGGNAKTNQIVYSYDGIIWNESANVGPLFPSNCSGICWNGNKWIAIGDNTSNKEKSSLAYSYDGINWILIETTNCNKTNYTNGRFVASKLILPYIKHLDI